MLHFKHNQVPVAAGRVLMAVCAFFVTATDAMAQEVDETLKTFFVNRLSNGKGTYTDNVPMELSEIEAKQAAVWQAWVAANNELDEETLIPLENLSLKKSSSWTLPSDLEPNAVMKYYFGKKGERPDNGYPMFVYLHGSGDRDNEWAIGHQFSTTFKDGPSTYFVPRIPNTGNYYRWWQQSKQWAWEKLLRQAYLNEDIDPNRIYFFGVSEGGYGSQRLASFYADYLAGAGPMAGGEPLKNAPVENCRNIAFNFRTGAEDYGFFRNTLTQYTADAFASLQSQYPDGFVHHIELLEGYGHSIDYTKTTPWLAQYTRNPHPKHVMWECFDMDGVRRKGFYNLYVEEDPRGNLSYRVYYVMDIEGNDIELSVKRTTYECTESQDGIEMAFKRYRSEVNKGKIRIYLNNDLVDLSKPVSVRANGKLLFHGMVQPNLQDMANSLATFYDPERIFPASVLIDMKAEEVTAITSPVTATESQQFYDLSGKPVTTPRKGVHISSTGKKVLF